MQMPNFGIKTLLIAFAAFALWLSAFSGYPGSDDIRSVILLLLLVASAAKAYCYTGRRKMFWLAFTVVMLAIAYNAGGFAPRFSWLAYLNPPQDDLFGPPQPAAPPSPTPTSELQQTDGRLFGPYHTVELVQEAIMLFVIVVVGTAAGLISVYIYDHRPLKE
jgi:hypothetical protein